MTVSALTYYRIRFRQWRRSWDAGVYRLIVALELEDFLASILRKVNK